MKKNKLLIILSILAAVLVFGAVFAISRNVADTDLYTVRIDYVIDGESKPFKTVIEEFEAGASANIAAPTKLGYQPRQASFVAIVNSDYVVTVVYDCLHASGYDLGTVISYPTDTEDGVIEYGCLTCDHSYRESFTALSRTITFGGDAVADLPEVFLNDYGYGIAPTEQFIFLKKSFVPEWQVFFDYGITFGASAAAPENVTVTFEYDESVWGENAISFRRSLSQSVDTDYHFRLATGGNNAIIFRSIYMNVTASEWLDAEDCPLVTSPIKVTLTYDWRK